MTSLIPHYSVAQQVNHICLRNYSELGDSIKFRVFDVLVSGLSCLAAHIERLLSETCEDSESAFERKVARNALKVNLFLLKWFMVSADKDTADLPAESKVKSTQIVDSNTLI